MYSQILEYKCGCTLILIILYIVVVTYVDVENGWDFLIVVHNNKNYYYLIARSMSTPACAVYIRARVYFI